MIQNLQNYFNELFVFYKRIVKIKWQFKFVGNGRKSGKVGETLKMFEQN